MTVKLVRMLTRHGETLAPMPEGPQHLWTEEEWKAVADFQRQLLELDKCIEGCGIGVT